MHVYDILYTYTVTACDAYKVLQSSVNLEMSDLTFIIKWDNRIRHTNVEDLNSLGFRPSTCIRENDTNLR